MLFSHHGLTFANPVAVKFETSYGGIGKETVETEQGRVF